MSAVTIDHPAPADEAQAEAARSTGHELNPGRHRPDWEFDALPPDSPLLAALFDPSRAAEDAVRPLAGA